jgi:hypothetical protein
MHSNPSQTCPLFPYTMAQPLVNILYRLTMSSASRDKQPTTRYRLGKQFESPKKSRHRQHTKDFILPPSQRIKQYHLFERLNALKQPTKSQVEDDPPSLNVEEHIADNDWIDVPEPETPIPVERRIVPDGDAYRLYNSWKTLLPSLVDPFLKYTQISIGKIVQPATSIPTTCTKLCSVKSTDIICLYLDRKWYYKIICKLVGTNCSLPDFRTINVIGCTCQTIPQVLVQAGLFPTSPSQPRMAVSLDLLEFYYALFQRSCDAVNALASALHSYYTRRGFPMLNEKVFNIRLLASVAHVNTIHIGRSLPRPIPSWFRLCHSMV